MTNNQELSTVIGSIVQELDLLRGGNNFKLVYKASGVFGNLTSSCLIYRSDLYGNKEGYIVPIETTHTLLSVVEYARELSYVENAGTWFAMTITIDADGNVMVDFDFDTEPMRHGRFFHRHDYMLDLVKYPIEPKHMKPWLKKRLTRDKVIA